jgi:DNA modification methylase
MKHNNMNYNLIRDFDILPVNDDWCFKNARSTEQWTHGYHRYPAKFLPNLVQKLIEEYTIKNDLIVDFFAGCGTTLVEAKAHGRKSIGVDINPVAELITNAKIKPIEPIRLEKKFKKIVASFELFDIKNLNALVTHDRIDYWFVKENKEKIAYIYSEILSIKSKEERTFFLVSLSHILKNCSRWLQSSTKPQIDPKKTTIDPFNAFEKHSKKMIKKNNLFYKELIDKNIIKTKCEIRLEDARKTSLKSNSVRTIITSPPYVTSYEYADIHQLTAYWYEYVKDIIDFRRNFIGTFHSLNQELNTISKLGKAIVEELEKKDLKTAKEVANYFNDMYSVAEEMKRVLKKNGHTCLVIGNTTFKDVKIKSAEVFADILKSLGFDIENVIKRSIPSKLIPSIRDKKTGKFTKLINEDSKLVYPEEYIIIAKKK